MKLSKQCGLAAILTLSVVSCGGDDDNNNSDTIRLSVDSASVSLIAGETKTVAVTIKRPKSVSGSVDLSVAGAPADVVVTLTPVAATDSATMTIASTAASASAVFNLRLIATSDALAAAATISVTLGDPAPLSVTGHVVNGSGFRVVPTAVSVWQRNATTPQAATIAADGTFTASGIVPPYDVRADVGTTRLLYIGMTVADPALISQLAFLSNSSSFSGATVSGTIASAEPTNGRTSVAALCPGASESDSNVSGSFSLDLDGDLAAGTACTAYALRGVFNDNNAPTSWVAYEEQPFTATAGSTAVSFALAANSVTSRNVTLTADPSFAPATTSFDLAWVIDGKLAVDAGGVQPGVGFAVPNGRDFAVSVTAEAENGLSARFEHVGADATTVNFAAIPSASFVFTGATSSTFGVEGASSAPATYYYIIAGQGNSFTNVVATGGVDAAKLNARGLTLASDQNYVVYAAALFTSPFDEALGGIETLFSPASLALRIAIVGQLGNLPIP